MYIWIRKRRRTNCSISGTNGHNNPKNSNPEDLNPFEYSGTERRTRQRAEFCQGQWYNRNYWRPWQVVSNSARQKCDVMKIDDEWDMLIEKLKALQQSFNEERVKEEKYPRTIHVLQKDLKWTKAARTAADNLTCLHSDIFEMITDKSQDNESVLSWSTQRKLSSSESGKKYSK